MASFAAPDLPVLGYHKIRGLAAPLRMMFYYKKASFINNTYGADMKETWFGADKPQLLENNSCMNLPYIVDGPIVVTQSNSCAVYLGKKLGIDSGELGAFAHNHTVLDQTMDLRNDLMKVVYPFGASGDFMLFEMIDQHMAIAAAVGAPAFFDAYPKLKKFHATMKALPALAPYFASAPYASWAQNNGLFTHFTGQPASFDYGPSVSETITF
ncbi:glutathione transferase [Aureococcus anophagefferens]|nr:glutathione transferase [Aureococcus anophagefferens]